MILLNIQFTNIPKNNNNNNNNNNTIIIIIIIIKRERGGGRERERGGIKYTCVLSCASMTSYLFF